MKTSIKICIILICSLQTFAFDKKSDDLKKIQKLDSLIDSKKNNFLKLFLKLEVYASWRHFNQKIIIPLDSLKKFVCTYQKELGLDTFETKAFSKYIEFYFKNRLKKQDSSKIDFADIAKSVGEIIMKRQMIEGLKYAFYGHLCEELEPLLIEEKTKQLKGNKLALITKPTTLLLFYEYYKSILNEANEDIIDDENNNLLENTYFLNQNLSKIQARMDYIIDLTYCQYKYASTSSKALEIIIIKNI